MSVGKRRGTSGSHFEADSPSTIFKVGDLTPQATQQPMEVSLM
jgi:hypothetical protein